MEDNTSPPVQRRTCSDDAKAVHMSIGIALIFFGILSWYLSYVGSNTVQNFVVPIYSILFVFLYEIKSH